MGRSRQGEERDARVGEALLAATEAVHGPRVLLAGGVAEPVARALAAGGHRVTRWSRRIGEGVPKGSVSPWPPSGPFDSAVLRIPRSVGELEMTAAALAGVLVPGGRIVVAGGNDEGIRPAAERIGRWFERDEVVATRRHCRVVAGVARLGAGAETRDISAWRRVSEIAIGGAPRPWVGYPGVFAGGGLDEGTALLIAHLPLLRAHARVLDFAAGSGVIAAAVRAALPEARVDMIEADSVALLAANENAPGCRAILATSLADANGRYDLVVSNPPIHDGKAEDHSALAHLVEGAVRHVIPGGILLLVAQRRVPVAALLAQSWREHSVVAENGGFRVWQATSPRGARDGEGR